MFSWLGFYSPRECQDDTPLSKQGRSMPLRVASSSAGLEKIHDGSLPTFSYCTWLCMLLPLILSVTTTLLPFFSSSTKWRDGMEASQPTSQLGALSLGPASDTSSPLKIAKEQLSVAVKRFEESYSAYVSSRSKSSPPISVTLQEIASSYELTALNNGISDVGGTFGGAVEKGLLASVGLTPEPRPESGTRAKKGREVMRAWAEKTGEFVGKLLPLAMLACGVAAVVGDASVIALPLKSVANGTALILQLAQDEKDRGEELQYELGRISYQSRRVSEIQKNPRDAIHPLLLEKSLRLMTEVINFLNASLIYWQHGFFYRLSKTILLGPEVWQKATRELHLAYEEYDQALLLQIANTLIVQSVQNKAAKLEAIDDTFKSWLSPSNWEVEAQLLANRSQRSEGTLKWVLELDEFRTWRVGGQEGRKGIAQTLWITGLPGVGKSTISAYLYDLLTHQYPENDILYFFCKSGTPGLGNSHNIVRTICYQLTQKNSFYRRYLQRMPTLPSTEGCEGLVLLFNSLIKEPLQQGHQESDVFILLDGLDELESSAPSSTHSAYGLKTEIEVLLESLVVLPHTRILVTSRSSPQLKRILGESGSTHNITRGDNSADIGRYVKSRLEKSPNLAQRFEQVEKSPVEYLSGKSNGIFLWVVMVLDLLDRATSMNTFSSVLQNTPPQLNNLYDQILTRARKSENYKFIKEVIGWTLIVRTPFTVDQMKQAVENSAGDEIFDMEDLLRSECGSLVDLVPVFGSAFGQSYEIHIGHETFQAYLTDTTRSGELFDARIAHGKAALACLRYLTSDRVSSKDAFHDYAITMWRLHMMKSIGFTASESVNSIPRNRHEAGHPLPPALARNVFVVLYRFLTTDKMDPWLDSYLQRDQWRGSAFDEVIRCCLDILLFSKVNVGALLDKSEFSLTVVESGAFYDWRDAMVAGNHSPILKSTWPRACRVWLWNTWTCWNDVFQAYRTLVSFDIWTNNGETDKLGLELKKRMQKEENKESVQDLASSRPPLIPLSAVLEREFNKSMEDQSHFDAIASAGGYDNLSGTCHANLAAGCYYRGSCGKFDDRDREALFEEGLLHLDEALDEDPDGSPRYYESAGHLYEKLQKKELALEAFLKGSVIDHRNVTECRKQYYLRRKEILTSGDSPDLDAAIALFEEAILQDPKNANKYYFHQIGAMYEQKGDFEGARRTLRQNMKFDHSWGGLWDEIARTYVDMRNVKERRKFDWRGYCDTYREAAVQDPSYAQSYWSSWLSKAEELKGKQDFKTAIEILEYGIETTSNMRILSADEAQSKFEQLLGQCYCAMVQWETAIPLLEDSLKHQREKDTDIYRYLGHAYMYCGHYDEALAAFAKIIEENASTARSYASRGEIHILSQQPAKAIKEYKTAIRHCEAWVEERAAAWDDFRGKPKLDKAVGAILLDLGCVYDRLARTEQALSCFRKALPHFEYAAATDPRVTGKRKFLHRSEGRIFVSIAWLHERLGDLKTAKSWYEKAVWVFQTAVWAEDDFLEEAERVEAEEALARVERGEEWVFPGEEVDRGIRERRRAREYRSNWGVNLEKPERSMVRGRA